MKVENRQRIEKEIVTAVVRAAVKEGYTFILDNGGDSVIKLNGEKDTLAAMFATDEERLYLFNGKRRIGWVFFVYGNDGWDVINDHTATETMEALLADANAIADKYQ